MGGESPERGKQREAASCFFFCFGGGSRSRLRKKKKRRRAINRFFSFQVPPMISFAFCAITVTNETNLLPAATRRSMKQLAETVSNAQKALREEMECFRLSARSDFLDFSLSLYRSFVVFLVAQLRGPDLPTRVSLPPQISL